MNRNCFFAAIAILLAWVPAQAADVKLGALQISSPWTRATPKGATIGGGYLTIANAGATPDRLIGGSSPSVDKVEIHEMSMAKGVMTMRPLASGLEIKPGAMVALKPGGLHIMFVGLKQPLAKGGTLKVKLTFEKAGAVEVDFAIAGIGAQSPDGGAAPGGHMPGMKH